MYIRVPGSLRSLLYNSFMTSALVHFCPELHFCPNCTSLHFLIKCHVFTDKRLRSGLHQCIDVCPADHMLQVTMMRLTPLPVTLISTSASDQHAADDRKRLKSVEADVVRFLSSRV